MARMTESELEETLKILYHADRYLYDCLCIHLMDLDEEIKNLNREIGSYSGTVEALTEEIQFLTRRMQILKDKMLTSK